ncbi:MAG: VC_2705 family sodium/solute symporter, partial [Rubrivivax sp.]|nr:VC_2705 family sodium/solute symporter [Rubrivivax sp.]
MRVGPAQQGGSGPWRRRLDAIYGAYALCFAGFVLSLGLLERMGLPRHWIGAFFLGGTVIVYAVIGIFSRTTDATEYYVAGRRVPAFYNGMATGADWMSAASFIGLAGTLYLHGFSGTPGEPGGLAFLLGWTGGFCLVALLLAPYLRRFGQFTIPDFLGARYGGLWPRLLGVMAAILCSFTYVVAQIYGVGLVTTHLTGVAFEIGIFLGLGGILVCSFLGGMRAVTWTQVGQYIVLIIAYSVPVVWLSVKQTGVPLPQLVYGAQLEKVSAREAELLADPRERAVIEAFAARARETTARLDNVPAALAAQRAGAVRALAELKSANAPLAQIQAAEKALHNLPRGADAAREAWTRQRDD